MTSLPTIPGVAAPLLLCLLLFAEEVGLPLPFSPGEIILIAGGILVAAQKIDASLFIVLAIASVLLGAVTGFTWARLLGEPALLALATRLHVGGHLERAFTNLRGRGPLAVAVSRAVPGLRVYTNLVAGAAGVRWRDFLRGIVPVIVLWAPFWTLVGMAVGVPAIRFLGDAERLAVRAALLVVVALVAYLVVRKLAAMALARIDHHES